MKPRREIRALAGYDNRKEPGGGIGGVTLQFILRRGRDAITWELLTTMYPSTVEFATHRPTAGAVFAHVHEADTDGYWDGPNACDLIPGGKCWNTFGYLIGDSVYDALLTGGDDAVFQRLDEILTEWLKPEEAA